MTGIEIESSEVVYNGICSEWWLTVGLMGFVPCLMLMAFCIADHFKVFAIFCAALAIACMVLVAFGMIPNENSIKYVEHKMKISEDVPLLEFYEKYEIVRQDEDIYIVRERK